MILVSLITDPHIAIALPQQIAILSFALLRAKLILTKVSLSASFQPNVGVALRDIFFLSTALATVQPQQQQKLQNSNWPMSPGHPAVYSTQHADQFEWRMPSCRVTDAVCRKLGCPTVVKSAAFPFLNEPYPDSYLFVNAQNQWSLSECRRLTKMWRQMVLLGCSHKMWVEWNWTIEKHHLIIYVHFQSHDSACSPHQR